MLCFCSDKLFKVAHLFAHSENLVVAFNFHLLWDTLSGGLSVQLLRSESINRRWWSNPNRGQRLNVFVARFARGGRYYSRAGDKWRMHYSEHTNTLFLIYSIKSILLHNQIRLLEVPINYFFNSRGSIICYSAGGECIQSWCVGDQIQTRRRRFNVFLGHKCRHSSPTGQVLL